MATVHNSTVRCSPVRLGRGSTAIAGRRSAVAVVAVTGVLLLAATACGGGTTTARLLKTPASRGPASDARSSNTSVTRDPEVVLHALDAVGLALCHSDYSDLAEYNIYRLFGAVSTKRYFPHRAAVPIHSVNAEAVSCITPNQPDTGAIEIDVYPTPTAASGALRRVGQVWLTGWLYGNIAVLVDKTVPLLQSQQVGDVLDHLPGAIPVRL